MTSPIPARTAPRSRLLERAAALLDNRVTAALLYPRRVPDYLELVDPLLARHETRARISEIRRETERAVTLVLEPSLRFDGYRAGQHATLTVELDGVRRTRTFSFSSAPETGAVTMTVQARPGGLVSTWAVERALPGDVVVLGEAGGAMVLPDELPDELLFVAGGSGVTPIASLLESLVARGYRGRARCVVYVRERATALLADRLEALGSRMEDLRVCFSVTGEAPSPGQLEGHFRPEHLEAVGIDPERAHVYVCGPEGLRDDVRRFFHARGLSARVLSEAFTARMPVRAPRGGARHGVNFARSGRVAIGDEDTPLLEQAERAGLAPRHGCRQGLCHSCECTLATGTVEDLQTGALTDEPGRKIRLCVTVPRSDVTVAV